MAKARQKRAKSGRKEGVLRELNTNKTLYLMCLPALLLLFLLCYLPFGGIWMAFTDFNALDGVFGSPFVGLRNFSIFFKQLTAWNVVKNTLIINFFGIILGLIVPISLAIFLNEMRLGIYKRVVQSVMFFPYFLSWVVVGAIVYGLLATDVGVVNNVLKSMDMEPVRWFAEPKYWKTILIAANVWKWSGYNSIVYLAAITNFDPNLFEAAQVDGASRFQQILHLTIPMLKPTAVVLTLLSVGRIFYGDFGMVYGIVGENPILVDAVNVIDTCLLYTSSSSLSRKLASAQTDARTIFVIGR